MLERCRAAAAGAADRVGHPAQRHPPVDRGGRTHAAADRRAPPGLGRGLGDHRRRRSAYTNHTLLPEALETWPLAIFGDSCPGTWRSSTRSTTASSTRCARSSPATRTGSRRMSLIGEDHGKCVRMAHLATVGSHADQRRRGAALRTAESQCAQRLLRDVAGAVRQRDQRCDAAAVPGAVQPGTAGAARRDHRRRLADRPGPAARAGAASSTTRRSGSAGERSSGPTRPGSPSTCTPRPASSWTQTGCSTSRSSGSTSTSASTSTRCTSSRCTTGSSRTPALTIAAARLHLRRQGRARLLHGQADHQAHHRRRRDGEQRSRRQPLHESRVPARTSTCRTRT